MKNMDEFDGFLKKSFQETGRYIEDDGFTERILRNLPMVEQPLRRNILLFLACIIAVFLFVISSGYKSLFMAMMEIFGNGVNLIKPSMISIVILSIFIGVSMCIARIEYEKNIV